MKKVQIFAIALVIIAFGAGSLAAQSLKGMSFNGSTGLYSIPSGRVGWEQTANIGLDIGYHLIAGDGNVTHIPKAALTLFRLWELNFAVDIQPKSPDVEQNSGTNVIFGTKFQFPTGNRIAVSLGGNFQILKSRAEGPYVHDNAGQIYLAMTYPGSFFTWPSETTVVLGYTFGTDLPNGNIDYGMGFDLVLLPDVFQNMIHWIIDFSNFTYVALPPGYALSTARGFLNTGIRIDFASIIRQERFKIALDIIMTDAFDSNRGFAFGGVFGIGL